MTTLVTGASGFLGSHIARLLVDRGERVRLLVRPTSRLDAIAGLRCEIVHGDLLDRGSLEPAVHGVQQVFHAAADYRLWSRDPQVIYETNVTGTRNLFHVCHAANLQRVVYTSSVATIAAATPDGPLPDETSVVRSGDVVGHYKRSKLLAEREAIDAGSAGLPIVIVNPTTPVGPGDWKPTPTGRIIVDALRGRMPAYVETGLNLVPVEDVAAGHLLAAERGQIGARYILGGDNMSLQAILRMIAAISGQRAPALRIPHALATAVAYASEMTARMTGGEPGVPLEGARMARSTMFVDTSRARRELGFTSGSVERALERAVRWYIEHDYAAPGVASKYYAAHTRSQMSRS